jgi:lysophospholipase L1-like esterase
LLRWLVDHAGLQRPYRFDRTFPVLAAAALALVVGAVAVRLSLRGELSLQAPRGWYFLYLAALLALALALARRPRLAAVALSLAALEIGLGFGSAVLYKYRLAGSATLFPRNYTRPAHGWHPLLQVLPLPMAPDQADKARVFINAERLRGRQRSATELKGKVVIALFGGSTTLDFVSPEGQTWPDQLERLLGPDRYAVINRGVSGYTTAEHLLQTAFYQRSFGVEPACAVYYIGWNDLRNAHIAGLDPGYADWHLRTMVDALEARRAARPLLSVSPTLSLLGRLAGLAFDTVRPAGSPRGQASADPDPTLEAIYRRNIEAISAINRQRGVRTIWIGQVMNRAALTREETDGWLPFVHEKDVWPLLSRLNGIVRQEAARLGDVYVDVPVGDFHPADFGDEGHFSPRGSLRFATLLAPQLKLACP